MFRALAFILTLAIGLPVIPYVFAVDDSPITVPNPGSDLWRAVRNAEQGNSQMQGIESGILINEHGYSWAQFRSTKLVKYAPLVLASVILLVILFYVLRGKIGIEGGLSGRMVKRFNDYERIVHWTLAIVFLYLAITGLILLLGRTLLIPLLGQQIFALLASASKESHNLFGPIFLASLVMMIFSFTRRNIYEKGDLTWLIKGGGLVGKSHVSGGFFNMGEKTWYWIVILLGLAISVSGLILVSPNFDQGRVIMEISQIIHVLAAIVLITVSIGHMYLGSIGTEGTLEGMKTGYVDFNWANVHHDRWGKKCHENDLTISADEYAKLQGKKSDPDAVASMEPEK